MLLVLISYLAGALTILSPCILPVLPFVFARAGRPFVTSTLPMLAGMALTFSLVASLAAVGGAWVIAANEWGRALAMVVLAGFGLLLLFPALATRVTRPVVALGSRLDQSGSRGGTWGSFVLGVATGLLWAPCAGPVLGLILTGAALNGANIGTTLLLLTYAAGASTALALALGVGGGVYRVMKRSLGAGEWLRRVAGALVLVSVVAIALGVDTGFLTRVSLAGTNQLEQALIDQIAPEVMPSQPEGEVTMMATGDAAAPEALPIEHLTPTLEGAVEWLNSPPLSMDDLRGKVVLIDFWTYSCINCLRALPYVKAWSERYTDEGLVVIGVHSPEFAFEKRLSNVAAAVTDLGVTYPVAIDNDYAIWRAFENRYWPAHYFIDAEGRVRHHHFGEGDYEESEQIIRQLLVEAGAQTLPDGPATVIAEGTAAPADFAQIQSPETYLGYLRARNFADANGLIIEKMHEYTSVEPRRNQWGLTGSWMVGPESSTLGEADGGIYFRFHARDLHLVLGPDGEPVDFVVTLDGEPPGDAHGVDIDADGTGTVTEERLYQLIRQPGAVDDDHTFEIRFLTPGVTAYAFTFG